ncbi:MAG: methyltransferase [Planctomycetota bacterium]
MSVPAARRDQRLRRHPLRRLRLPVAGGTLSLVVPKDDSAAHARAAGASAARRAGGAEPPYWATVWPAAIALARWLCRRGDLAGRRALDLGCGTGAAGAAAVRCGASVTFADRDPDALAFAGFNGRAQLPEDSQDVARDRAARVREQLLDWHTTTLDGAFDLLLLADVSYRPVHHAPLLRHLRGCLRPDGMAVHADPLRRESDGFLVQARAEFAHRELRVDTHFDGARRSVRLWFLARDEAALTRWLGAGDRAAAPAATERP